MQHQQVITAPPTVQYGQGYGSAGQSWQPAPYPGQQGVSQYPAAGWGGYGQTQVQPQPYSPVPRQYPTQSVPQYQQPYQPAPQYQPYQVQPQYQPAQRPWGVPGNTQGSGSAENRSIDTWQMPGGQSQGWNPPAHNGYSGQYGTVPGSTWPGYYW